MKYIKFVQHENAAPGVGHYWARLNPETGEGYGWFGTADTMEYRITNRFVCGQPMGGNCGIGPGCVWTESPGFWPYQ